MSNVFLDKEDVWAIARQRPFQIKIKPWRKRLVQVLATIGIITGLVGLYKYTACIPLGTVILGAAWMINWLNYGPLRKKHQEFVDNWARTGSIPGRWPVRNGYDESLYNEQDGPRKPALRG